jgi:hypothetical protein
MGTARNGHVNRIGRRGNGVIFETGFEDGLLKTGEETTG